MLPLVHIVMDPIYFSAGGFVFVIFIFKRELLVHRKSFSWVLAVTILLFVIGLITQFTEAGRSSASGALFCPLLSLGLYRLCRKLFLSRFKHEPKDTYLDWSPGLGPDRLFNILYLTLAVCLWISIPVLVHRVTKAGW